MATCILKLDCGVLLRRFQCYNKLFPFRCGYFQNISTETCSFTNRTHTCGELRSNHTGQIVTLCGWIQYKRMGKFAVLRDAYGVTQVTVPEKSSAVIKYLSSLPLESVIQVTGEVMKRPEDQFNHKMATGEIEIEVESIQLLNRCIPNLPFNIRNHHQVNEPLRLKHRYLDLRRPEMQHILRLRSSMVMRMREFLCNKHAFVDVETPSLFRRTPGGAQEFVVPTKFPGKFYSLVQSPQQFKQLLMIGALDRYFQIARCFRDEHSRPDRQPEFSQVDLEMSFVTSKGIMSLVEELLQYSWPEDKRSFKTPFLRMSYSEAQQTYGTDKPDTRYGMKLIELTFLLKGQGLAVFDKVLAEENTSVQAIVIPQGSKYIKTAELERFEDIAKSYSLKGVLNIQIKPNMTWNSFLAKHLSPELQIKVNHHLDVNSHDLILLSAGNTEQVRRLLGKLRVESCAHLQSKGVDIFDPKDFNFLWIVDFPLFFPKDEGGLESAHHPFTAPHPDDLSLIYTEPNKCRSQHYDLVLNGQEIGGGSIRIHNSQLQRYILETVLQEDVSTLHHFLEALDYGCPPHGGIALGLDRLIAILCDCPNIREVMAFPKSLDGKDLMSEAPSVISDSEKRLYHLFVPSSD